MLHSPGAQLFVDYIEAQCTEKEMYMGLIIPADIRSLSNGCVIDPSTLASQDTLHSWESTSKAVGDEVLGDVCVGVGDSGWRGGTRTLQTNDGFALHGHNNCGGGSDRGNEGFAQS